MNKKVFIAMLSLSICFLIGMYVLKIFFSEEFMMSIQNEKIIAIGTFIDSHKWLYYICCGVTAFITYYLYCCACSRRLYLKWYECLIIVATVVIIRLCGLYVDENIRTILSVTSFVFLPAMMGGELKRCAIVYTIHAIAQGLSLGIRGLAVYLATSNFATITILAIDMYLWLGLFYIIYNYKNKES